MENSDVSIEQISISPTKIGKIPKKISKAINKQQQRKTKEFFTSSTESIV